MKKRLLTLLLSVSVLVSCVLPADVVSATTLSDNDLTVEPVEQEMETEESGTCGSGVSWSFSGDTLTISGSGAMKDFIAGTPWDSFKGSIRNLNIANGVTAIGVHAFSGCTGLKNVTVPGSVQKIGFAAFSDCTGLENVSVVNGVIGESAFIRCSSLKTVTIGAGVKAIGISAFENCNAMQGVYINDIAAWCKIDFGGFLANPTQFAKHLYLNGAEVTDLQIPDGVTKINDYAFEYCQSIGHVSIPGSVKSIGNYAFYMCTGISSVDVPGSGVTYIGSSAFDSCSSLRNISIPSTVSFIGSSAFTWTPIGSVSVNQGVIEAHAFEGCGALNKLNLGAGVTKIGDAAFNKCDAMDAHYGGTINYGGSQAMWEALPIGNSNGVLAKAKFTATGSGDPSFAQQPEGVSAGATVRFGAFEQDNNGGNGKERLEWTVLDVQGDKALIVTKKVIDFQRYANSFEGLSADWSTSLLRTWLNNDFANAAFSAEEKSKIAATAVGSSANPVYGNAIGAGASDQVFILSDEEIEKYFQTDSERMAECTAYALARSGDSALRNPITGTSYWWVRTAGIEKYNAMYVHYTGTPVCSGMAVSNTIVGVRPAVWVDKNAVEAVVEESKVASFVTRLYNVCLNREPDAAGKATWVNQLNAGTKTGAQVAYGFVFSEEFQNRNFCNEDYVKQLYRAFMGREGDEGGLKYWINKLETGTTREEVFNGFSQSAEFNNLCKEYGITLGNGIDIPKYGTVPKGKCTVCGETDGVTTFVTRLYNVCLDRDPDEAGLNDWTTKLWAHTRSGKDVSFGFIFSQEFQNKGLSDEDYVEYLYKAFFDRPSDEKGKSDWLNRMHTQGYSREAVFNGFVGSTEFDNLCKKYGITRDK